LCMVERKYWVAYEYVRSSYKTDERQSNNAITTHIIKTILIAR